MQKHYHYNCFTMTWLLSEAGFIFCCWNKWELLNSKLNAKQFPTANTFPRPPLQAPDALTRRWAKRPGDLDLWPFDLESDVRVTCDVSYLCANFGLPRPLCSRLRPDVQDRCQTDRRQTASSLYMPPIRGGGIISQFCQEATLHKLIIKIICAGVIVRWRRSFQSWFDTYWKCNNREELLGHESRWCIVQTADRLHESGLS